jgi:hypothetical protein
MRFATLILLLALCGCTPCMREDILHRDCNWIENGG